MKRFGIAVLMLFLYCPKGRLEAAENLRAARGGFTTAIHAVLWAANEEKIFRTGSTWSIWLSTPGGWACRDSTGFSAANHAVLGLAAQ